MVVANTVNAGADIGAIAAAFNILVPIPAVVFVIPVGIGIALIQLFGSYAVIARIFKWLAMALLRTSPRRCSPIPTSAPSWPAP